MHKHILAASIDQARRDAFCRIINRPVWASICEQLNALVQNVINEKQRAAALIEDYRENQNKRSEASERRLLQSQTIMSLVLSIFSPLAFISG
jgi:hypothetical protein